MARLVVVLLGDGWDGAGGQVWPEVSIHPFGHRLRAAGRTAGNCHGAAPAEVSVDRKQATGRKQQQAGKRQAAGGPYMSPLHHGQCQRTSSMRCTARGIMARPARGGASWRSRGCSAATADGRAASARAAHTVRLMRAAGMAREAAACLEGGAGGRAGGRGRWAGR